MKLYIASLFSRKEEMAKVAEKLKAAGFEITSEWVNGSEDGLPLSEIAMRDLAELEEADAILAFTEPKGSLNPGGGHNVEFGAAAALGKYLYFIGGLETVFHSLPWAQQFKDVDEFIARKGRL